MSFQDTLDYMYNLLPMYQRVGKTAFKKDLTNTFRLCEKLENPHEHYPSVHIAGTNGKGSSAHMLASILQASGYKTGLYTSPHLQNFTERIKVDGHEISEDFVVAFIERLKPEIEVVQPSFFEITVCMAFEYFSKQKVDIAIIEVGLGGRFDSTNVVTPLISLITSIGLDHTDMLGDTLDKIAFEKAGIIKGKVPVVISETQPETTLVFAEKASQMMAPIYFADEEIKVFERDSLSGYLQFDVDTAEGTLRYETDLAGEYQLKNIPGVMKVVELLREKRFEISRDHVQEGFKKVIPKTGLLGRWQRLYEKPLTICDTVHNAAGVGFLTNQIRKITYNKLHIIWGAVEGKDLNEIFLQLPVDAFYYFCESSIPRAMAAEKLHVIAASSGCQGVVIKDVNEAIDQVREVADEKDLIIIGGSNFVIAEIKNLKR